MTDPQKSILFIGNYFSSKGLNQGIAKELTPRLTERGWKVLASSTYVNKIVRLLDMVFTAVKMRGHYKVANIDVFSDQAFIFAEVMSFVLNLLKKKKLYTF